MKLKLPLIICLYLSFYNIDLHALATPTIRELFDENKINDIEIIAARIGKRLEHIESRLKSINDEFAALTESLKDAIDHAKAKKRFIDSSN